MTIATQRILAILLTGALLLGIFELIRRKHLQERYALLWLLAGVTLLVLAVWKGLLTTVANDLGIRYAPSAFFTIALGFILLILVHFSTTVSRLADQNKVLAQRVGLLQHQVDEQQHRLESGAPEFPDHDAAQAGPGDPVSFTT